MTEEIKILLDILNKVKDYDDKRYFISCGENDYLLTNDEIKCLLNYITNLQKENTELKKLCDKYKEQLQNISNEFLKYDWENSTKEQIVNQLKNLYNSIFKNGGDEE